ncbi:hypothetical protein AHF37_11507 [Paragonimus kellicotti]|nr:hypothetical protein AHF37_11507 [Paragonimus kellicotti]
MEGQSGQRALLHTRVQDQAYPPPINSRRPNLSKTCVDRVPEARMCIAVWPYPNDGFAYGADRQGCVRLAACYDGDVTEQRIKVVRTAR